MIAVSNVVSLSPIVLPFREKLIHSREMPMLMKVENMVRLSFIPICLNNMEELIVVKRHECKQCGKAFGCHRSL